MPPDTLVGWTNLVAKSDQSAIRKSGGGGAEAEIEQRRPAHDWSSCYVLVHFWNSLGTSWEVFGNILGTLLEVVGTILGTFWGQFGNIFGTIQEVFWMLFSN